MEQLEMLWAYQAEDMKADAIANEIRRSPTRMELEKKRNFIMDQQKQFNQIDEKLVNMKDRLDVIQEAINRLNEQLNSISVRVEQNPPEDIQATQSLIGEVTRLRESIVSYESEAIRIQKDTNTMINRRRSVLQGAATAKKEFDTLKAGYDVEVKGLKESLEAQKAVAAKMTAGIDAALMERYNAIKKHIGHPVAKLIGDQCSGCNTSLPSALTRKIRNGEILECETCGRLLIP